MCKKSTESGKQPKDWSRPLGALLLFICAAAIIFSFCWYIFKTPAPEVTYTIDLRIEADSTGTLTSSSQAAIDSVIMVVKDQESVIRHKYEHILEQKENTQTLLSLGSILITIIIAIFGFFGYKSYSSIEDKAVLNAEAIATKMARDRTKDGLEDVEKSLKAIIVEKFENETKEQKKAIAEELLAEYNFKLDPRISRLEDTDKKLKELDGKVADIMTLLSKLEDKGLVAEQKSKVDIAALDNPRTSRRRKNVFDANKEGSK